MLLLTTRGRRTRQLYTIPLLFHRESDRSLLVVAVNGTEDSDPDWLGNLRASPAAEVEIDGVGRSVVATVLDDPERMRAWEDAGYAFPGLVPAQAECRRPIPFVRLIEV